MCPMNKKAWSNIWWSGIFLLATISSVIMLVCLFTSQESTLLSPQCSLKVGQLLYFFLQRCVHACVCVSSVCPEISHRNFLITLNQAAFWVSVVPPTKAFVWHRICIHIHIHTHTNTDWGEPQILWRMRLFLAHLGTRLLWGDPTAMAERNPRPSSLCVQNSNDFIMGHMSKDVSVIYYFSCSSSDLFNDFISQAAQLFFNRIMASTSRVHTVRLGCFPSLPPITPLSLLTVAVIRGPCSWACSMASFTWFCTASRANSKLLRLLPIAKVAAKRWSRTTKLPQGAPSSDTPTWRRQN